MAKTQKTYDEKISDVAKEITHLENLKKKLLQEKKDRDSKERAHRLIQRGATLENKIGNGSDKLTNDQINQLIELAFADETVRQIIAEMLGQNLPESNIEPQIQQSEIGEDTGEKSETERATPDGK
ncbi:MAG: DUF3847 domain-containing protein [Oscillospiraceae bacterium]|nr:DUF3847 domain-containing protein [Oscillospiraceae bacterium]